MFFSPCFKSAIMNEFFQLFGGPMAVLISIISTIVVYRKWKSHSCETVRKPLVALLYWGPVFLMSTMLLHNIQNGYRAIQSINEAGVFNFYFYSLQLFGCVVGYQSYLLLKACRDHVTTAKKYQRQLFWYMSLIVITTLPTFVFTPIGIIPPAVLVITLVVSLTLHKLKVVEREISVEEETFLKAGLETTA
jgi:hypothetical protein